MRSEPELVRSSPDDVVTQLAERACTRAGFDDFGADSWRDGLAVLVDSCESTPGVIPAGRDDLYAKFVDALANRLRVVGYVKQHPEIAQERVERPLVVIGL